MVNNCALLLLARRCITPAHEPEVRLALLGNQADLTTRCHTHSGLELGINRHDLSGGL